MKLLRRTPTTKLYFECHVTIEPVFEADLAAVKVLASSCNFRVADLLMKKRPQDTAERSRYDTFCTGRSKSYRDLDRRMHTLIFLLQDAGFVIWRYKIEDTLLDVRCRP